jgi:hypothetical protein
MGCLICNGPVLPVCVVINPLLLVSGPRTVMTSVPAMTLAEARPIPVKAVGQELEGLLKP